MTIKKNKPYHTDRYKRRLVNRQSAFLKALQKNSGYIARACRAVNISEESIWIWRHDPKFETKMEEVLDCLGPLCEQEAIRRGKDGILKPVFYKGEKVATVREHSDLLLKTVMHARHKRYKADAEMAAGIDRPFNITISQVKETEVPNAGS